MTFKVLGRLTNTRSPKDENPVLTISPSKGIIKLNSPAAMLAGLAVGDYVTIIAAETEKGKGYFLTKGVAPADGVDQVGSKVSPSTAGVMGGTVQFSSENAWRELGGNETTRKIYNVGATPVEDGDQKYYELTFDREEAKQVREKETEGAE